MINFDIKKLKFQTEYIVDNYKLHTKHVTFDVRYLLFCK